MTRLLFLMLFCASFSSQGQERKDLPLKESNYNWDESKQDWRLNRELIYEYDSQNRVVKKTQRINYGQEAALTLDSEENWQYKPNSIHFEKINYSYDPENGNRSYQSGITIDSLFNSQKQLVEIRQNYYQENYSNYNVYKSLTRTSLSYDNNGYLIERLFESGSSSSKKEIIFDRIEKTTYERDEQGRVTLELTESINEFRSSPGRKIEYEYSDDLYIQKTYWFDNWDKAWKQREHFERRGSPEALEESIYQWRLINYFDPPSDTLYFRILNKYSDKGHLIENVEDRKLKYEGSWLPDYRASYYYDFNDLLSLERTEKFWYNAQETRPAMRVLNLLRHSFDENKFLIKTECDNKNYNQEVLERDFQYSVEYLNDCEGAVLESKTKYSKAIYPGNTNNSLPPDQKKTFQYLPIGPCDETIKNINLRIFPNPSKYFLFVESDWLLDPTTELQIYDLNGRLVRTESKSIGLRRQLNLTDLPKGSYFLQLIKGEETAIQKFLLLH